MWEIVGIAVATANVLVATWMIAINVKERPGRNQHHERR